ncbi:hypothetical protein WME90_06320 [Sorangium sp. So ce375]|uniref:hypothetical protein n=1 Tax=Sorangium sp. So ce375 TaxID=3133306 RepID=UPI003F5BDE59
MTTEKRIHDRASILTCGIDVKDIPELINAERMDFTKPETAQWMASQKKDAYRHDEIFGTSCTLTEFIECPLEIVYDYTANAFSMEEWTATVRSFEHVGGGLYRGVDAIAKNTPLYLRIEANDAARTVDFLCAWDQGLDLWMRYFFRLFDAFPVIGKPGTILLWTNYKHPYYDKNSAAPSYIMESRARADRPWVGEFWDLFNVVHGMEARNIKTILEHRFRSLEAAARRGAK